LTDYFILYVNNIMIYNEDDIKKLYEESLSVAKQLLAYLPVAEGRKPTIKGLNGWVYEQTICHCLLQELNRVGIVTFFSEQASLGGRAKVDLLVGRAAIEIKASGSFGNDANKYSEYRIKAEQKGWVYFYLTNQEAYLPYRLATTKAFGKERAFFLDTPGDWERFVKEVLNNYKRKP